MATATYATTPTLFDAYQASHGLSGALTVPTTTALATGLTAFADVRSWKLELEHGIDDGRWTQNGGLRGQPTAGELTGKFSADVEYNATTVQTALVAGTQSPWYCTYTTAETLGVGFTQLQVVVPRLGWIKGLPDVKPGETVVASPEADVLNDGVNRTCYVVYRTTDTAL